MKEIYDWVPWFKELGERIAEGGEQYLIDKAKTVPWKDDDSKSPLLKYGDDNIDPFSFFYTLASLSKSRGSRNRIYPGIVSAFELTATLPLDLDDAFIFPMPPGMNTLFHKSGEGNPALLWRLFRDAVAGLKTVKAGDFDQALNLPNIATRKLTQTLFLINPHEFIPADDQTNSLGLFDSMTGSYRYETVCIVHTQDQREVSRVRAVRSQPVCLSAIERKHGEYEQVLSDQRERI